jgi:predicted Fe-Mo cluster-binding NifX family protein
MKGFNVTTSTWYIIVVMLLVDLQMGELEHFTLQPTSHTSSPSQSSALATLQNNHHDVLIITSDSPVALQIH